MITTNNITVQFGKKPLFEDISITFSKGNVYGLIGANGSGKSTFMNVLSGDLEPSSGTVSIQKDYRISLLSQDQYAFEKYKIIDCVMMGHKKLWDIIPFEIDNLQITYLNENNAEGYATGIDLKLFGEFVSGVDSWISLSLLKTQEDIEGDGHGYIPRPTDQRFAFSLFFQDYFPGNPSYKMNLKLHYSSGLPSGAINSERHEQVFRIPAYRRVDIGFTKVIKELGQGSKSKYFKHFDSLWISAEVFNLLGIRNTISYLWVSDVVQNQYAVPNYLTSRLLNLKLQAKF